MLHAFQGYEYFRGGGAALLTPLPATGTALSSLSRTATSPVDRFSLEKEQPGSGKCWHAGLSWLAAGQRSRVPCSRALKFVDVFLSRPDGGDCAVGKRLSRYAQGAKRSFLPHCLPRGRWVTPALAAGCVCNASNNDPASTGPSSAPAVRGGGGGRRCHFSLRTTPGETRLPKCPHRWGAGATAADPERPRGCVPPGKCVFSIPNTTYYVRAQAFPCPESSMVCSSSPEQDLAPAMMLWSLSWH